LAQYAGVLAALAEGHELGRVLAHEGIEAARWPDAERAWAEQLAESAGHGVLIDTFDEHLAVAQDRYGRRLPPLDEDLRAFLDFRRRWAADPDPPALVERVGLRLAEVTRLCRLWSKRTANDPALAEQTQAILREEPGYLVLPTPVRLDLPPPPSASETAPPEPALDDDPADGAPPLFVPLPGWAPDDGGAEPAGTIGSPSAPQRDGANAAEEAPRVRRARPSFLLTSAFVAPVGGPALPFRAAHANPAASVVPAVAATVPFVAQAPAGSERDAGSSEGEAQSTAPMPAILPDARMPFEPAEEAGAGRKAQPAPSATTRAPVSLTDTASFEGVLLAAILPFARSGGTEEFPAPARRLPSAMAQTTAVSVVAGVPALPFAEASATSGGPGTKLSVGQYAAFCAELEVFADAVPETFRRYGLASVLEGIEVAEVWQRRFERDADDYQTWERLHRFYLDHCRTKGRPEVKP
jgi:hypothetical protein